MIPSYHFPEFIGMKPVGLPTEIACNIDRLVICSQTLKIAHLQRRQDMPDTVL